MSRKTEWYPAHIKPARVGWYETQNPFHPGKRSPFRWWWNGQEWVDSKGFQTAYQHRPWRGLAGGAL